MKKLIYILVLALLGTVIKAQSPLGGYLQIAAEQNPGLKAKYNLYLAALEKVNNQGALPDPTLSFGYFISPVETRVGAQNLKLSLSQMFPWMGTTKAREEMASEIARVRFEEFQHAKNQLFLEVKNKWLQLYELEEEIKITQSNLNILRSYEPITKTKYESNQSSLADLIRVQISIDDATTKIDLLAIKKAALTSDFNTLLNRNIDMEVKVSDTLNIDNSTMYPVDSMLTSQPMIKIVEAKLNAVDKEILLADLKRKPNVGVGLDYGFISKREGIVVEDNGKDIIMPMVSLSLPIFGKKNKSLKKEAELKKEGLKHEQNAIENELKNQWSQTEYELQAVAIQLSFYQKEIDKTNTLLNLLTSEYTNNGRDFEDLLKTQQQLLQLYLAQIKSQVKRQEILFKKNYLTGFTLNKL